MLREEFREFLPGWESDICGRPFDRPPYLFGRVEFRGVRGLEEQYHVVGQLEAFGLMECGVVHLQDVELVGAFLGKVIQKGLEAYRGTVGHLQFEPVAVYRGIGPKEVGVAEDLLKWAYRLGPSGREPFSHMGEEPETALVLAIEVYLWVTPVLGIDQC